MGRGRGQARAGFICGLTACSRSLGIPRRGATSGRSGYGPPLGLPDRLPGRRGAAGLGPQRAAAPGDGGAEVLLPGEGCAWRRCGSRDPCLRRALCPVRPGRWGAGGASLHLHPSGRSPLCFCSLAGAESSAARLGWCGSVPPPPPKQPEPTSARPPALPIRRGTRGVGAPLFLPSWFVHLFWSFLPGEGARGCARAHTHTHTHTHSIFIFAEPGSS